MDKSGEIELLIEGKENMTVNQIEIDVDLPSNIIEDMVGAVTEGRSVIVDGEEGRKSVQIFTAVYESSRTGKIIHLF